MGRFAYYSPLWMGALLVLALNDALRAGVPRWEPWQQWTLVAAVALLVALQCQVLMVGAQGAFAQVLPVPAGRSIRGAGAVASGWLLIGWVVMSAVTALVATDGITLGAYVLGGISLGLLATALAIYVWNIPAAIPDFRDQPDRA